MGGARAHWLGLALLAGLAPAAWAAPLDDGRALYRQKKYAEAVAILGPLAAAEPANADAAYFLGMSYLRRGGPDSLDSARLWLGKATTLAPNNSGYLGDYAGVTLLMADRDSSLQLALEGRNAMRRAIEADPTNIEACEGLMNFYARAPFPIGSSTRALDLAAKIAKLDPKRGAAAYLSIAEQFEKDGRKQQALAAMQAAQSLAPGHGQ
jgi:tetratricopeptide (TPR) repeat protein